MFALVEGVTLLEGTAHFGRLNALTSGEMWSDLHSPKRSSQLGLVFQEV